MILTKRGKPTAMVSPPPPETSKRWIPDQLEGKITIVGDIVAPLGVPWEALE